MILTGFWNSITETLCLPQLHVVVRQTLYSKENVCYAIRFYDGYLVVSSGSSKVPFGAKYCNWLKLETCSVIPVSCLPLNSTMVILFTVTLGEI